MNVARGGTTYFELLARIVQSCAHDVEAQAYYDDVTDDEQRELEQLVASLRRAAEIATALNPRAVDPARGLRHRQTLGNRVQLTIELANAASDRADVAS